MNSTSEINNLLIDTIGLSYFKCLAILVLLSLVILVIIIKLLFNLVLETIEYFQQTLIEIKKEREFNIETDTIIAKEELKIYELDKMHKKELKELRLTIEILKEELEEGD